MDTTTPGARSAPGGGAAEGGAPVVVSIPGPRGVWGAGGPQGSPKLVGRVLIGRVPFFRNFIFYSARRAGARRPPKGRFRTHSIADSLDLNLCLVGWFFEGSLCEVGVRLVGGRRGVFGRRRSCFGACRGMVFNGVSPHLQRRLCAAAVLRSVSKSNVWLTWFVE